MESFNGLGNILYDSQKNYVLFELDLTVYPLKVVYQAAYILMDKASVILGGNSNNILKVEIRPLNSDYSLNDLIGLFNEELLTYASYFVFSAESKKFRDFIISNILTNASSVSKNDSHSDIDDVEKIFEEWEKEDESE